MTGNVVILGMAATGTTDLPVLGPVLALMFFLVGAAAAGRVLAVGVVSGFFVGGGMLGTLIAGPIA